MRQYLDLVRDIMMRGKVKHPPQGVDAISLAGACMHFDLDEGFPLITTRSLQGSWRAICGELLWFLSGSTDIRDLRAKFGVHLWDAWATPEICARFGRKPGDLGPLYGQQWTNFGATPSRFSENGSTLEYAKDGRNQIAIAVDLLKRTPDSRRIRVSSWNIKDVWKDSEGREENVFITPCHGTFQLFHAEGELSMILNQYSGDVPVGIPFNTAEYALLLMMIAQVVGMKAKELIHFIGDAHIYVNQISDMEEQLKREPRQLPRVSINPDAKDIFSFRLDDFTLDGYDPHPAIKGIPVAL